MTKYYTVQQAIDAECTLEPIKCEHCGHVGEVSYNQVVGDYHCAVCGYWHNVKRDATMKSKQQNVGGLVIAQKLTKTQQNNILFIEPIRGDYLPPPQLVGSPLGPAKSVIGRSMTHHMWYIPYVVGRLLLCLNNQLSKR